MYMAGIGWCCKPEGLLQLVLQFVPVVCTAHHCSLQGTARYSRWNGGSYTLDGSCQILPESLQICNVLLKLHTLHFALLC